MAKQPKQLNLFENAYPIRPLSEIEPDDPAASERRTMGGEQASASGRGTEGARGLSYVNSRTHTYETNHPSNHKHIPRRINVKGNNLIVIDYYPEGRLIIFKETKGRRKSVKEVIQYDNGIVKVLVFKKGDDSWLVR